MQGFTFDLTEYDLEACSRNGPGKYMYAEKSKVPEVRVATADSSDSELEKSTEDQLPHLSGWRLQTLNFSLCLGLFLSLLETTIMSTSLLSIINEFGQQDQSSWVVTAYLLTYTGFIIPLAKLSDIYGRRPILAGSIILYIVASASCGWSHSMTELCIFRAFQGIGGGGIFGLTFIIVPEMVPKSKYAKYSVILSSAFALGNLLGPILGGLINNNTTWRWIFWLNLPGGAITLILSFISLPAAFPYHYKPASERPSMGLVSLKRIDFLGAFLLLSGTCLLVACLEVGGNQYAWNSSTPLALLASSLVCWIYLVVWQWLQHHRSAASSTQDRSIREPVLPWRILTNRFTMGALLNALCFGAAFFSIVINLPLRFQIVDGDSPLTAGYRILPITVIAPFGSVLAGIFTQRLKVPPIYMLILGGCIQTLGLGLYAGLGAGDLTIHNSMYAYEIITGLGFGLTMNTAILLIPAVVEKRDLAVGMGFIGQFRSLGGSIGIAGCANLLNKILGDDLLGLVQEGGITPEQVAAIKGDTRVLAGLGEEVRLQFVQAYADGFKKEMILATAFCAGCVMVSALLLERRPRGIEGK